MPSTSPVFFLLFGILISCIFVEAQAQVNFSPTWGKRASETLQQIPSSEHTFQAVEDCKLPFDGVLRVVRLIQMEAQRLMRCGSLGGESVK